MGNCLFLIDIQQGLITHNTSHILSPINRLIHNNTFDCVVASRYIRDSHPISLQPWFKEDMVLFPTIEQNSALIINRSIYSAVTNDLLIFFKTNDINTVYIAGIDTEGSVLATATNLFCHDISTYILKDCCASTGGLVSHNAGLQVMQRIIGEKSIVYSRPSAREKYTN